MQAFLRDMAAYAGISLWITLPRMSFHCVWIFSIRFSRYVRPKQALPPRQMLSLTALMGLSGLEPPTSRLSGVRSNRLSYKPEENLIEILFLLHYLKFMQMIYLQLETKRFELSTPCLQGRCSPN